jgi:hypothetical protein
MKTGKRHMQRQQLLPKVGILLGEFNQVTELANLQHITAAAAAAAGSWEHMARSISSQKGHLCTCAARKHE